MKQKKPADKQAAHISSNQSSGKQTDRPSTQQKKRKISTGRKIAIIGGTIVAVAAIILVAGHVYLRSLTDLVEQGDVTGDPTLGITDLIQEEQETVNQSDDVAGISEAHSQQNEIDQIDIPYSEDVYNILLIGSDNRGDEVNGRSDAMIILSINNKTQKVHMVSLMRALYVDIPGHGLSLLNHSFSYGGSKLLLQTIEDNFRIKIDDYAMIDFKGFTKAVDAVGGVDINLTKAEVNHLKETEGYALVAGVNHLDGALALSYSRIRHIDSDFQRTSRQRTVIDALISKITKLDPVKLDRVARKILPLIKTNLGADQIVYLEKRRVGFHHLSGRHRQHGHGPNRGRGDRRCFSHADDPAHHLAHYQRYVHFSGRQCDEYRL